MPKQKQKNNYLIPIAIILGLLLIAGAIYYSANKGWFSSNVKLITNITETLENLEDIDATCTLDINPNNICLGDSITGTITDGENTPCYIFVYDDGWTPIYEGTTNPQGIWTETHTISATGIFELRGYCDKDSSNTYSDDDCFTNIETLTINPCDDPIPPPPPVYNDGDHIGGITDSDNLGEGITAILTPIDLGDFPPTTGDGCKLQALIDIGWKYKNEECLGIQGNEGMHFELFDSNGKVWERTDTSPSALGSATYCGLQWDGETEWMFTAEKILGMYYCEILLDYDIEIVTCDCP